MRRINVVIEYRPSAAPLDAPSLYRAYFVGLVNVWGTGDSISEALGTLLYLHGHRVGLALDVQPITSEEQPVSADPIKARSAQQPATAEDLFLQLDSFAQARQTLDQLGLLDAAVATALDTLEAKIRGHLAATIEFAPGAKVRLVRHADTLYAYDESGGAPSFEPVEPVDATAILLGEGPV